MPRVRKKLPKDACKPMNISDILNLIRDEAIKWWPQLNLAAILLVLAFGVFLWFSRSAQFTQDTARRRALELWLFHWIAALAIYILFGSRGDIFTGKLEDLGWVSIWFNDIQSIFLIAFSYAIVRGSALDFSRTLKGVMLVAALSIVFNFLAASVIHAIGPAPESVLRWAWSLPSALVSSIAFMSLGLSFILRCGWITLPLFVSCTCYSAAQWGLYQGTVKGAIDARWCVTIAFLKLVVAGFLYLYFTAPFRDFEPLAVAARDEEVRSHFARHMKGRAGIFQGVTIGVLTALIISFLGI